MDVGNMYRKYGSSAMQEQLPRGVSWERKLDAVAVIRLLAEILNSVIPANADTSDREIQVLRGWV